MSELYGDWSIIANGKLVSDINDLLLSTLTKEKKKPEKKSLGKGLLASITSMNSLACSKALPECILTSRSGKKTWTLGLGAHFPVYADA